MKNFNPLTLLSLCQIGKQTYDRGQTPSFLRQYRILEYYFIKVVHKVT